MPDVKAKHVVSFSSEDPKHPAENLLKPEGTAKWKSASPGDKSVSAVLQLEKACVIHQIDVGNEGSAFIEVLVGRSSQKEDDYQVILIASTFMSPQESRAGTNINRVRIFGADKLSNAVQSEKWDRIKVVCSQPFSKTSTYGLCFLNLHSPPDDSEKVDAKPFGGFKLKTDPGSGSIKPGSLFSQAKEKKPDTPLSGAAAVRAAARYADATSLSSAFTSPRPDVEKTKNHERTQSSPAEVASLKRKHTEERRPSTPDASLKRKHSETKRPSTPEVAAKRRMSEDKRPATPEVA